MKKTDKKATKSTSKAGSSPVKVKKLTVDDLEAVDRVKAGFLPSPAQRCPGGQMREDSCKGYGDPHPDDPKAML